MTRVFIKGRRRDSPTDKFFFVRPDGRLTPLRIFARMFDPATVFQTVAEMLVASPDYEFDVFDIHGRLVPRLHRGWRMTYSRSNRNWTAFHAESRRWLKAATEPELLQAINDAMKQIA